MNHFAGCDDFAEFQGASVSIGNFDGVHRGHCAMLDVLVTGARRLQQAAIAVTFDPHPLVILRPDVAPTNLTTITHRTELLKAAGADAVLVLRSSPELLRLTAAEFFEQVVLEELKARRLVEGPNFFFGRDRAGNITVLTQLCAAHGVALEVIDPVMVEHQWVSSSVIRSLLVDGDMNAAAALLGHPYRLTGRVVVGAGRGRGLGFPTANLDDFATVVPGLGVYAGRCIIDGCSYAAAIHIGPNPTFGEARRKVEVHLLDYSGELYGRTLDMDFLARVRDVTRFESADALRSQLARDVASVCAIATQSGEPGA